MNELHALVIPAEKFCFCLSLSAEGRRTGSATEKHARS